MMSRQSRVDKDVRLFKCSSRNGKKHSAETTTTTLTSEQSATLSFHWVQSIDQSQHYNNKIEHEAKVKVVVQVEQTAKQVRHLQTAHQE